MESSSVYIIIVIKEHLKNMHEKCRSHTNRYVNESLLQCYICQCVFFHQHILTVSLGIMQYCVDSYNLVFNQENDFQVDEINHILKLCFFFRPLLSRNVVACIARTPDLRNLRYVKCD